MTQTINRVKAVRDSIAEFVRSFSDGDLKFVGDHTTHRIFPNQLLLGRDGKEFVVTIVETQKPRLPRV